MSASEPKNTQAMMSEPSRVSSDHLDGSWSRAASAGWRWLTEARGTRDRQPLGRVGVLESQQDAKEPAGERLLEQWKHNVVN